MPSPTVVIYTVAALILLALVSWLVIIWLQDHPRIVTESRIWKWKVITKGNGRVYVKRGPYYLTDKYYPKLVWGHTPFDSTTHRTPVSAIKRWEQDTLHAKALRKERKKGEKTVSIKTVHVDYISE